MRSSHTQTSVENRFWMVLGLAQFWVFWFFSGGCGRGAYLVTGLLKGSMAESMFRNVRTNRDT